MVNLPSNAFEINAELSEIINSKWFARIITIATIITIIIGIMTDIKEKIVENTEVESAPLLYSKMKEEIKIRVPVAGGKIGKMVHSHL